MPEHLISTAAREGAPSRILILDRDPEQPRLLLATIGVPADIRAAPEGTGRYGDWDAVKSWVRSRAGRSRIAVVPVTGALAWHVLEGSAR